MRRIHEYVLDFDVRWGSIERGFIVASRSIRLHRENWTKVLIPFSGKHSDCSYFRPEVATGADELTGGSHNQAEKLAVTLPLGSRQSDLAEIDG
jgi:hypothetical protein